MYITYLYRPYSEGIGKVLFIHKRGGWRVPHRYLIILQSTGPMTFPEGTPVPGPMSLPREYPSSPRWGVTPLGQDGTTPLPKPGQDEGNWLAWTRWGTPSTRTIWGTPSQDWMGHPLLLGTRWEYPPPPGDRVAKQVLSTHERYASSSRRAFLYFNLFTHEIVVCSGCNIQPYALEE